MKKLAFNPILLILLIVLGLILNACTDQPPTLVPVTPGPTLPLPSTPGPTAQAEPEEKEITPVPSTYLALPAPTPSRTAAPVPALTGPMPGLTALPGPESNPNAARLLARLAGQAKTADGKPEPWRAMAVSPDNRWLVLADRSEIWVLSLESGQLLQRLAASSTNPDERGAHSLAWSADSRMLAAGGLSGVITLWRWDSASTRFRNGPQRLAPSAMAEAFGDTVEVAFSRDSRLLAGFGSDGNLTLYSTASYAVQAYFVSDYAGYVSWAPDGSRLVDEFLLLHYLKPRQSTGPGEPIAIGADGPQGVAWSPDGKYIAVSGDGFELMLVEPPTPGDAEPAPALSQVAFLGPLRSRPQTSNTPAIMPHLKEGRRVAWAPSSRWVAVANVPEAGKISLWDIQGQLLLTLDASNEVIRALCWPQDGLLLSAGNDGSARLWQLTGPVPPATPRP